MKRRITFCVYILVSFFVYPDNNGLLNDYKLLYTDLLNIETCGYKSFFNHEINRTSEVVNISQGAIEITDYNFDCAVMGEGFFKIRLANNLIGYTRAGNFLVNPDGVIVTSRGYYPLYESICLGERYIPESFIITGDGAVYINHFDKNGEITGSKAGEILTYQIPAEYLTHYDGAIYVIKYGIQYEEEIAADNNIIQGAVECCNYELLPVVMRMYYVLSIIDDNIIPDIQFKRELLKIFITKFYDWDVDNRIYFLEQMLPFLECD